VSVGARQGLERFGAAPPPAGLLDLVEAAERQPGEALGFLARPAGPQVPLDLALAVEAQLLVQLALHGAAPEECTAAVGQVTQFAQHRTLLGYLRPPRHEYERCDVTLEAYSKRLSGRP